VETSAAAGRHPGAAEPVPNRAKTLATGVSTWKLRLRRVATPGTQSSCRTERRLGDWSFHVETSASVGRHLLPLASCPSTGSQCRAFPRRNFQLREVATSCVGNEPRATTRATEVSTWKLSTRAGRSLLTAVSLAFDQWPVNRLSTWKVPTVRASRVSRRPRAEGHGGLRDSRFHVETLNFGRPLPAPLACCASGRRPVFSTFHLESRDCECPPHPPSTDLHPFNLPSEGSHD